MPVNPEQRGKDNNWLALITHCSISPGLSASSLPSSFPEHE